MEMDRFEGERDYNANVEWKKSSLRMSEILTPLAIFRLKMRL